MSRPGSSGQQPGQVGALITDLTTSAQPAEPPPGAPPLPLPVVGQTTGSGPVLSGEVTKVNPDVLEAAIKDYTGILDSLVDAHKRGEALTRVLGPGKDVPSQLYARAANEAGHKHQQANENMQAAVRARIDKLKATLDQYHETEHSNAHAFKKRD